MTIIPKKMIGTLSSYLKFGKSRSTALTLFKPRVVAKEKLEELTELENIQKKFTEKTLGSSEDHDIEFLNAGQSKNMKTKFLGYLGCEMFLTGSMKLLLINTLKKDLVDTFSDLKISDFIHKHICQRHTVIRIQTIPLNTKIAVHYLLNNTDKYIEEIKNDIQFVCDPIYLLLFYKLWKKELDIKSLGSSFIPDTNNNEVEDSISNEISKNNVEVMAGKKEKIPNKNVEKKKNIMEKTISDFFEENGYNYPFKNKSVEKINYDIISVDMEKYTRDFFSLRLSIMSIENGTILIKLQILLEQDKISLSRKEIDFLLALFRQTKCFMTKTIIVEVLTKTENIEENHTWNKVIFAKINFNGIYILSAERLALLYACLKYLIVHNLFVTDINLFLFRLMHALCPDIVSCALKLLRYRHISRKQVIDRCLKFEGSDDLSTETLILYVTEKTCIFTFKSIKSMNLLDSNRNKIKKVIRKIFEVSDDEFRFKIARKYPSLAEKFRIIDLIQKEDILIKLRDIAIENLSKHTISMVCEIIDRGFGFKSPESDDEYESFFKNSFSILLKDGRYDQETNIDTTKQKYSDYRTVDNLISTSRNLSEIKQKLCYLISIALRFGNTDRNRILFEEYNKNVECPNIKKILDENLDLFNLI